MSTIPTKPARPATQKRKNSGYRNNNNKSNRKIAPNNSQAQISMGASRQKHENEGRNIHRNDFHESEAPHETTIQVFPFVIGIAAIYILICFLMNDAKDDVGGIGVFIRNTFYGLFSNVAFLIPFMMASVAFFYKKDLTSGFFRYRLIFSGVCLVLYSALAHLFSGFSGGFSVSVLFNNGKNYTGGGAVGGILSEVLTKCVGTIGAGIFIISLSGTFSIFLFGYTPVDVIKFVVTFVRDYKKSRQQGFERKVIIRRRDRNHVFKMKTHKYRISSRAAYANSADIHEDINIKDKSDKKSRAKSSDVSCETNKDDKYSDNSNKIIDNKNDTEKIENIESKKIKEITLKSKSEPLWVPEKSFFESESKSGGNKNKRRIYSHPDILDDVDNIFFNGEDDIDIKMNTKDKEKDMNLYFADSLKASETLPTMRDDMPETEAEEQKSRELTFETLKVFDDYRDNMAIKEYKLPPLSYLTKDTNTQNMDVSGELAYTASRLIETLESFGVKTRVSAVSRGPSVTRYEVTPNAGVKVKSIVNLVDDIALNLASGGVRIEAPIPGKAAVGVEVPNKSVSTVYLRTLLEDSQFRQAASKITVALGMDVAGNPIYSDISKMPHLLIAGATGMGKSVCINSIITSVLYKSKPAEVKLMLIDPKKVELTIYNGIPHLLIPVVSDPKKAAGSLNWAVAEMESRFALIEEKGVRDLKSYNEAVASDNMAEKIPQIIIIIDELADLMMTAPADVEQSICRLAQKARAAGMHLIIGTQRPSVDVITGLIKANIPSRIAFTVASQIDSRTIIDAKGAEELIGRGDMLYLPVGAAKPIRVQGAYVSERDVMNVTDFLKKQSDGGYDEHILSEIEREAKKCNTKGAKMMMKENTSGYTENDV